MLARGSDRSVACARHYGVPLITDVEQVDADVACVVVRGGLLGGEGTELAKRLMARGVHVLQDWSITTSWPSACGWPAATAWCTSSTGSIRTFRRFAGFSPPCANCSPASARVIDAICGFQVAYAMLDIIGTALGRLLADL